MARPLLVAALARMVIAAVDNDLTILQDNVIKLLLPNPADSYDLSVVASIDTQVPVQASALNASGLFPDINYYDQNDRSEWAAATHLQRCLMFGVSFASNVSILHGHPLVQQACSRCVQGWLDANPQNSNWWWQQLGVLQVVSKALLLCPNATQLATANSLLYPRLTLADVQGFPGANRVWSSLVHVLIGVLNGNASHVDVAYSLMQASYAPVGPVEADGLQVDSSFHQHGPLAYFSYGYGAHFMANALTMELAAQGTRWSMSPAQWQAVSGYLLDGAAWVTRGSEFHLGAMGRHNTYYNTTDGYGVPNGHYHYYAAYPAFSMAFPSFSPPFDSGLAVWYARLLPPLLASGWGNGTTYPRAGEIQDLYKQVLLANASGYNAVAAAKVGHARFWRSDYSVHSRPTYSLSLHTFSNRTLNTECVNDEGLQNRGMADGALTVHVTGREYTGHAPVWRWSLIPGTTMLQTPSPFTCSDAQITDMGQRLSFVGGVTDGWAGAACMDLQRTDAKSTLIARKSWFFSEAGVIAVGAGIGQGLNSTGSAPLYNVVTTMDQRLLTAPVYYGTVDAPGTPVPVPADSLLERADVAWVLHERTVSGLLSPPTGGVGSTIGVSTKVQNGSLAAITQGPDTPISLPTFLSYIHHGPASYQNSSSVASYAYAVLPGLPPSVLPAQAAQRWEAFQASVAIMENSRQAQSVCWSAPNSTTQWLLQSVFWPPASSASAATDSPPMHGGRLQGAPPCPAATASFPCLAQVSLSTEGLLSVSASSPARESMSGGGPSVVVITLPGVQAVGAACTPTAGAGGGTTVTVQLPTHADTAGATAVVTCTVSQ